MRGAQEDAEKMILRPLYAAVSCQMLEDMKTELMDRCQAYYTVVPKGDKYRPLSEIIGTRLNTVVILI
jgi:hypothetical protein